jgi:hypothetical protein
VIGGSVRSHEAPGPVDLTAGRRSGLRKRPGIHVRRRDLAAEDLVRSRRLLLTGRALTVLETAIAIPEGSVFLDRALQKHVRFDDVYASYCRNLGAHGFADVATLLTAAADRADSAAERLMLGLLRGAGLTGWTHGHPFGRWTIDFAFPGAKIAIEVDGWAWHARVACGPENQCGVANSAPTGTRATPWSAAAGTCCASPGTT